ncbi:hypothetical protein [Cryobacterium zongtaii]|uniref:hypothetical protein n=1 Tax=Cryobacterium zongtaii TaxID=1259217 RepID=UPI00105716E8|nr:hypothetical protein [Cryobacterium zongtaii]
MRHTLRMPAGALPVAFALVAPMAGTFIAWLVEDGTEVAGDPVAVMEAIAATAAGRARLTGFARQ